MISSIVVCWAIAALGFYLKSYVFRHPKTRILPDILRHTWFAGFSHVLSCWLLCVPFLFTSFWYLAGGAFSGLIVVFRGDGVSLILDDVRAHQVDGRGLFRHSPSCYMHEGEAATFMINRWTKVRGREFPVDLEELEKH